MNELSNMFPEEVNGVLDYFEDTYIGRPVRRGPRHSTLFPIPMWNVYDRTMEGLPRMNNAVEGWYRAFQANMGAHHPTIWRFVNVIQHEEALARFIVEQGDAGYSAPPMRRVYAESNQHPTQTACGHRFCRDCIIGCLNGCNQECPIDKTPLNKNDLFYDSCIEREILQLKVKCPNSTLGCSCHIELKYVEDHLKACNYQPVLCPNECSVTVLQKELEDHLFSHCTQRLVKCEFCQSVYICDQEQLHMVDCPQVSVDCDRCGTAMTRDAVAVHKKEVCMQVEIPCILSDHGCHYKASRIQMKIHMEKSVDYHIQLLSTSYKKINALVLDLYRNIGQVATGNFSRQPSLRSQNSSSSNTFENQNHCQTEASFHFPCGAHGSGLSHSVVEEKAEWTFEREAKERQQSMLSLGSYKTDTLKGTESEDLCIQRSCSDQQTLLKTLSDRSIDVQQKFLENSIKVENFGSRLTTLETDVKLMFRELRNTFCNGVFVWKICNFLEEVKEMEVDGKILHSLPFHSSPFGYKFCLRTNVNVTGDEPFLTLYIHMMKGENDAFLNWPFLGKIIFQVLDCGDHTKKQHVTETMEVTTEMEAFQRPQMTRSVKGYGFKDFVSLKQILQSGLDCVYLKNDVLRIKVAVME